MKTLTIQVPDSPAMRDVLKYLTGQVMPEEIEHWDSEFQDAEARSEEEDAAQKMCSAWYDLQKAMEKVVK